MSNPMEVIKKHGGRAQYFTRTGRAKHGTVGEVIEPKTGQVISIHLDREHMEFLAFVGSEAYACKDGAVLRRDIISIARAAANLSWFPVIEINVGDSSEHRGHRGKQIHYATVQLAFDRFYLARPHDDAERMRICDWEVPEDQRLLKSDSSWFDKDKFRLPYRPSDKTHILEYSEDLYSSIEFLWESIKVLDNRVRGLIATPRGNLLLMEAAKSKSLLLGFDKSEEQK